MPLGALGWIWVRSWGFLVAILAVQGGQGGGREDCKWELPGGGEALRASGVALGLSLAELECKKTNCEKVFLVWAGARFWLS